MEAVLESLQKIRPLSSELILHLSEILQCRNFKKKEFVLKSGQVSRYISFISKGIFRCFYTREEHEISSWFMKEGDVMINVESFFLQKKSYENIQAMEDSEVYFISYEQLQSIYINFPEFNFIGRVLTEKYYTLSEQRLYAMRMQRSSERYLYLVDHHPDLIKRVPSKYLASYLGITEVTLSAIKSKVYR